MIRRLPSSPRPLKDAYHYSLPLRFFFPGGSLLVHHLMIMIMMIMMLFLMMMIIIIIMIMMTMMILPGPGKCWRLTVTLVVNYYHKKN